MKMRRMKIGIRPQLIILVCFSSLFSLLILAITTGVYYSNNLSNTRSERLEVISQLKGTQVLQAFQFTYYQVYWVGTRDVLSQPLSSYRAGNYSSGVFSDAQSTLDRLVSSSELFASARLYNLDQHVVVESFNNITQISNATMDALYPIRENAVLPDVIKNLDSSGYYTGPVSNSSDTFDRYFMGLTLPVYANMSVVFPSPTLAGYLTVLVSADNIQNAINQTNTTTQDDSLTKTTDYTVVCLRPVYGDPILGISNMSASTSSDRTQLIGYEAVLPVTGSELQPNNFYNINSSSEAREALTRTSGAAKNVKSSSREKVSIGFTRIKIDSRNSWSIIVRQSQGVFLGPINRLRNIIIGVVIGIGVAMCLITFPLAVYYVRPITKLKNATEAITKSKKEKKAQGGVSVSSAMHSPQGSLSRPSSPPAYEKGLAKRNSVNSNSTGSVYSTGICIPNKIRNSKKFFKDELTELTDAFNIMTDELEKQYTHLEDRVRSRTKELEASKIEAEAANEAKTVFIANISHELRTPLNGILGMTSIAMDEEEPTKIQDSLKLIHRSGELLLHILTELLTYSKNTLNRSKLEKSNFQILEVVYQVKSIFDKLALDQRVKFRILLKPNALRKLILYGDSNRIIQIVMNLVSNSLKFTPVDGSVDVSFKLLGEYDLDRSAANDYDKVYIKQEEPRHKLNKENLAKNDSSKIDPAPNVALSSKTNRGSSDDTSLPSQKDYFAKKEYFASDSDTHKASSDSTPKGAKRHSTASLLSVATLSTTEYENKIFESQFLYNKNLPSLPRTDTRSFSDDLREKRRNGLPDKYPPVPPKRYISDELVDEKRKNGEQKKETGGSDTERSKKESDTDRSEEKTEKDEHPWRPTGNPRNNSNNSSNGNNNQSNKSTSSTNIHSNSNLSTSKLADPSIPPSVPIPFHLERNPQLESNMSQNELVKNNKAYKIRNMYKPKTWAIQIEVRDTGPGIEPVLQEKVFEPFIQGDQTLSRSYGGTGLGLSICRQLATMMKGTLTLKSALGQGSTFTFTVPLPQTGEIMVNEEDMAEFCEDEFNPAARVNRKVEFAVDEEEESSKSDSSNMPRIVEPNTSDHRDSSSSNSPSARKHVLKLDMPSRTSLFEKPHLIARSSTGTASSGDRNETSNIMDHLAELKILVAEDNLVNQEVIKRMLKLEGFSDIVMACNGAEAVEQVQQSMEQNEPFDLVFMDVQMPKIDGLTATKMIRNNLQYQRPIIALTAFADESNMKECLNCGMTGFLAKPIRRTNLRKIIVEFSPIILSEVVTTPQTVGEEKRLGFPKAMSP